LTQRRQKIGAYVEACRTLERIERSRDGVGSADAQQDRIRSSLDQG
jgi:hypothetical protein